MDNSPEAQEIIDQAAVERGRFFALSLNMLCITGFDGYFKHLNPVWEQTLGFTNEELLSKPFLDFVHPDDQEATIAEAGKLANGGVARSFENRYRSKDGTYKWLIWNAFPLIDQQLIYATARDVTDLKREERRLAAQYEVTRVLAESATLDNAMPKIIEAVCQSVDWALGAFWTVDKQANLLRCKDVWLSPTVEAKEFVSVTGVTTFPPGIGLPGRVWSSGKPAWIPDIIRDTNFPRMPFAASNGLHGAFAFPILMAGEVTGVIEFFSREVRSPEDNLLNMMSALGSQIGQFTARKGVEEEREKLIAELQEALGNVKALSGLLPICATCKKVRDDRGYWNRIEDYVSAHSEAMFSHGICTECAMKLHPDWDEH